MVAHSCNPSTGGGHFNFLGSQPRLPEQPPGQCEAHLKKEIRKKGRGEAGEEGGEAGRKGEMRMVLPENQHLRVSSGIHLTHVHIHTQGWDGGVTKLPSCHQNIYQVVQTVNCGGKMCKFST